MHKRHLWGACGGSAVGACGGSTVGGGGGDGNETVTGRFKAWKMS